MKNFHQNLLLILAVALCLLCAYQWYGQTLQRGQIGTLNQTVYQQAAAIQSYTNSIRSLDGQIARMDGRIAELKAGAKTNEELVVTQKQEINKLLADSAASSVEIVQYKQAVDTLEARLKEAYDGIKKQNESIKEIAAQRDEFVQKLNDSVKERNDIVNKYNALAQQVEKLNQPADK